MNTTNTPIKFTTIDPLERTIVLKSSTWDEHIAPNHSENDIFAIQDNITHPHIIFRNTKPTQNQNQRNIYMSYKIIDNTLYNLKTVVEFKPIQEHGEIVTNYMLRKINEKEITEGDVLYDSSKS